MKNKFWHLPMGLLDLLYGCAGYPPPVRAVGWLERQWSALQYMRATDPGVQQICRFGHVQA